MDTLLSRRRLLGASSVAAASVAGCAAFDQDGQDPEESETENGSDGDVQTAEHDVTVVADIDETELQEAQAEVQAAQQEAQQQLEEGEIDEEEAQEIVQEAQQQLEETQRELLTEAIDAIESHAEDVEGLTVAESAPESGVALASGDGNAIVEMLLIDSVQALVDGSEFDQFRED